MITCMHSGCIHESNSCTVELRVGARLERLFNGFTEHKKNEITQELHDRLVCKFMQEYRKLFKDLIRQNRSL